MSARKLIVAITLTVSLSASTQEQAADSGFCTADLANEGSYIPEAFFTRSLALEALSDLEQIASQPWGGADWSSIDHRLILLQGYLFRDYLEGYQSEFAEVDEYVRQEFCEFLREAHIDP